MQFISKWIHKRFNATANLEYFFYVFPPVINPIPFFRSIQLEYICNQDWFVRLTEEWIETQLKLWTFPLCVKTFYGCNNKRRWMENFSSLQYFIILFSETDSNLVNCHSLKLKLSTYCEIIHRFRKLQNRK